MCHSIKNMQFRNEPCLSEGCGLVTDARNENSQPAHVSWNFYAITQTRFMSRAHTHTRKLHIVVRVGSIYT